MNMTSVRSGAILALVAVVLAACGDEAPSTQDDAASDTASSPVDVPTTTQPETPTPVPTPVPTPTPTPSPPTFIGPPDANTLVGVPYPGVEHNCWLLDDFLLLGGDRELIASGQELRITGHIEKDVMTTCQQGTPYRVESVDPTT